MDQKNDAKRFGYCAIIGRPNVGKSTIFNALLGRSVSIVTRKAQTTQSEIMGVVTCHAHQYVMLDTPGVQCRLKRRTKLNRVAAKSAFEADLALFVVGGSKWSDDDMAALQILKDFDGPVIGCINKLDRIANSPEKIQQTVEALQARYPFEKILTLSALRKIHVDVLNHEIGQYLPEGDAQFAEDVVTEHSDEFLIEEMVRAKLLEFLHEEIPYDAEVRVDLSRMVDDKQHIYVTIWVPSQTQKAVVIGKGGQKIKQIGQQARMMMEKHFQIPIVLKTWVKVGQPEQRG
jgi:GTP-binding protein Era